MGTPQFSEESLVHEVESLSAWRDRMRDAVVHLENAEYHDDTGETVNRAAEIESVLVVALDEIDQVIVLLQRTVAQRGFRRLQSEP